MASPATFKPATILHRSRVAPPCDAGEQTLPLTFYDLGWIHFHPIQRLLFFKFPCSQHHFLETVVQSLKKSLSQTLTHFLPMAGNLIYPVGGGPEAMPVFRYEFGDSVSVTVAEANEASDFDFLTGNSPRDSAEFYAFFPELGDAEYESGFRKSPVLAVQITLFPDSGFCIAINTDHSIGDASTMVGFFKAWGLISKHDCDESAAEKVLPFYDRSVITDPCGLTKIFWDQVKNVKIPSSHLRLPAGKVRATFILQKKEIEKLKAVVRAEKPELPHLSAFTVTSAYVWSCLARSAAEIGDTVHGDEPEYFAFAADARRRLDPPIPAMYFGNCVMMMAAELTHAELRGEKGFLTAAERIGVVIGTEANIKDNTFGKDADKQVEKFGSLIGRRLFGVAGSPKFDLYDADFGWGKPVKFEAAAIDGDGSMSLSKSREFDGGLEIGLSMPKEKMDAFSEIFAAGLKDLKMIN